MLEPKPVDPRPFLNSPVPQTCRLVDFDRAGVYSISAHLHILWVIGTKPYVNMDVNLRPVVYVTKPEYWEIEVVGCTGGILIPTEAPYSAYLMLFSTIGTKGIEVVGANRKERIDI